MDRRKTKDEGPRTKDQGPRTSKRWLAQLPLFGRWSFVVGLALLLSGCLLVSGERASTDAQPTAGNFSTSFVGAEGDEIREIDTGAPSADLDVIAIVQVERGELRLELLSPEGMMVYSVQGRPDEQITRSGVIQTTPEGKLRYRVVAHGARNGAYQLLYQRQGK